MCISIFYAQVIGLWVFLVALSMVVYQARMKKVVLETLGGGSLITFSGLIALGLGLLVVVSHNIWVAAWPVLVTLYGWVLVLQGVLRLFWPESFAKMMKNLLAGSGYKFLSWVWLIVGLYLIYVGFGSAN